MFGIRGREAVAVAAGWEGKNTMTALANTRTADSREAIDPTNVDEKQGLSTIEAMARRSTFGVNRIAADSHEPWWHALARQYADPMQIVLVVAGVGTLFPLRQWGTGLLLLVLTLLNAALGLHREGKKASAASAMRTMVVKANIRRDGILAEFPAEDLVPGDVVRLAAGDVVPADGRIIRAAALEVDESALTGESVRIAKNSEPVADAADPGDRTDMVYMYTTVARGTGTIVVISTGMATRAGHLSRLLQVEKPARTPLTRRLGRLTNRIFVIAGLALLLSMNLGFMRGVEFRVVLTAAIAFAIAAVPIAMPTVLTTILSFGAQTLAQANAIVKSLRTVDTLGSVSAINFDKTGTLTLNEMTAVELAIPGCRYLVSGTGYSTEGSIKQVPGQEDLPLEAFLLPMVLATDAVVTDGDLVGDPAEGALVVLAEKGGLDAATTRERFPRIAELPFDAAHKLMATFHRIVDEEGEEVIRCFVRGSVDHVLARAAWAPSPKLAAVPVDDDVCRHYLAERRRLAERGLSVVATARKDFDPATFDAEADLLPMLDGLTVLALVGLVDPPRPSARGAVARARAAGVQVRMITGDHAATAAAIARNLGIEGRTTTGAELAGQSDEAALRNIEQVGVIARATPEHKVRLAEILKAKGHIVATTGDGVDDAPALSRADIGFAVAVDGSEVAKRAAGVVVTDDDVATIVKAVELGRAVYANVQRYTAYQVGVVVGFMVTFLGAGIANVLAGLPLLPLQILWVGFTTLAFQAVGVGYDNADEHLARRRPPPDRLLSAGSLAWLAIAGVVIGAGTLAVVANAESASGVDLARTMGLTTFSLFALFFSFTVRSDLGSVFGHETFDRRRFVGTSLLSLAAIVLATELGLFQRLLQTVSLSLTQWVVCAAVASSIVVLSELRKALLRRLLAPVPART